ncbi:MAG: prepilin-type N-terminal cleavage/methylation domain-containing protein [Neisseriaceae bacterium]|nr:prepilin-type N-terminal cleavage/methylation domain-containing protein [Neisseriaceae bacterium]
MLSKKQHGFTLTELMIVVAVLAILAGIAIPSYSHFTKKAQLRKAQSALLENAHALEQVYAQNKKFADAAGKGIIDDTKYKVGEVDGKGGRLFSEVPGNKFKITTTYTGTDKYEMKAEADGAWANREKRYLTLDNTGNLVCHETADKLCKNF